MMMPTRTLVEKPDIARDEVDRLRAEVARLAAENARLAREFDDFRRSHATTLALRALRERDAVVKLCIHTCESTGERWSFVGNFGPVPYASMVRSMNDTDAINAVRRAAGLDRVKRGLGGSGIDYPPEDTP